LSIKWNKEELSSDIQALLDKYATGTPDKQNLLKEFIMSAVLYNWEDPEPEEIIPLKEGLDEIRQSLNMFKKYKYTFKISMFGSARTPDSDPYYKIASEFARIAAEEDFKIITGAGPGIMEAGNVGAGVENSFGLGLQLPFENNNPIFTDYPTHLTEFRHFYSRKLTFYRESQAIVVLPGGYGTLDEIFQGLASMQTGKILIRPFVLLDVPGGTFWSNFDHWVKDNLEQTGYISPDDLILYTICNDAHEGLSYIKRFYHNFFSYFVLDDRLFLQLKITLTDDQLGQLNHFISDFKFSEFFYVRERYFNYGTLYVYSCKLLDPHYCTSIWKTINFINSF